jgi:hypothetical protein
LPLSARIEIAAQVKALVLDAISFASAGAATTSPTRRAAPRSL